jgi:SAM-dependent methyltransferase
VNIPVCELPDRVHELPPRLATTRIADVGVEAAEALAWLEANGRAAVIASGFEFGESADLRLWSPNAFLEQCVSRIPVGMALDLACGSGRDAVFLASRGFEVTAIDHLADAIAMGRDLELRYAAGAPIQWLCDDLEKLPLTGQFDLVTCFYYLNRGLLENVGVLLRPGGYLVVETFTTVHRERFGKPRSKAFVLKPGELLQMASGLSVIEYEEDWHDGRHTARLVSRKVREV